MKRKMIGTALLLSMSMLAGCASKTVSNPEIVTDSVVETHTQEVEEIDNSAIQQDEVEEESVNEAVSEEKEETEEAFESAKEKSTLEIAKVPEKEKKQKKEVNVPSVKAPETIMFTDENVALADMIPENTVNEMVIKEVKEVVTTATTDHHSSKKHSSSNKTSGATLSQSNKVPKVKGDYKLVWNDEFDGNELDMTIWSYEPHQPGWVNNELQEYTTSTENVYVKDGKLIIQALETVDESGNKSYTSGRINTMNKKDTKYGRFEARLKVPKGQGFLPAFWMMPAQEELYGQWPKCGEIDIMEVLGSETDKAYATIHYGEPHEENQGSKKSVGRDYAETFHDYACEWEPGKISFYVDNTLVKEIDDWFTKRNGFDEVAYPAPFDQPFYVILNLAVGGNWPGNPDATTKFDENAQLQVDYVRVYQKDSYDENVEKPVKNVVLREPDETGNYIVNSDFSKKESLDDEKGWKFLTALGGEGKAEIKENALYVSTQDAGTVDYSIQVVQPDIPLQQGCKYKVSFDAYADVDRTIICSVTAPDRGYQRYLADTKLELGTEKKHYEYEFAMSQASDENGRMEFNLGNQKSTATVVITNVRVEKIGTFEIVKPDKSVLPDGNYVYNGTFDQGTNRMEYWKVKENKAGTKVYVTNENNVRELKVAVEEATLQSDVVVEQEKLALQKNHSYILSFKARGESAEQLKVNVAEQTFTADLSNQMKTYTYNFKTDDKLSDAALAFIFNSVGTIYVDDVRIVEEGMLTNADFSNGLTGYELFVDGSAQASASVDSLTEKNAACIDIKDTGAQDWCIQLKQNNVTLQKGKTYKLSFEAKCDMDRTMMYAIQRDGSSDDDWTPYSDSNRIELKGDYQTYSKTFTMDYATDKKAILSLSMGTFDGNRITKEHRIFIKNISLEEAFAIEDDEVENNLIQNSNFAKGTDKWETYTFADNANIYTDQNTLVYDIKKVGDEDWHVQLKQGNLDMVKGATYKLSFYIRSSKGRIIRYAFLDPENGYKWYGGDDVALTAGEMKKVTKEITITEAVEENANMTFVLSMGKIDDAEASKIEIANVVLERVDEESEDVLQTEALTDEVLKDIELSTEETVNAEEEMDTEVTEEDVDVNETVLDEDNVVSEENEEETTENEEDSEEVTENESDTNSSEQENE